MFSLPACLQLHHHTEGATVQQIHQTLEYFSRLLPLPPSLPPSLPASLPPHAASQWLKGGKDGTSQAAVSHSARLLVLRTAACRPVRWPRRTRQPPDQTPRSNYLFYTKTDLKLWPTAVAFPLLTHTHTHTHTLSPLPTLTHLHTQPAAGFTVSQHRCFLLKPSGAAAAAAGSVFYWDSTQGRSTERAENILHLIQTGGRGR